MRCHARRPALASPGERAVLEKALADTHLEHWRKMIRARLARLQP